METKYTPGPWKLDGGVLFDKDDNIVYHNLHDVRRIHIDLPTQRANTELIAQAPDLLAKVSELQTELNKYVEEIECDQCDGCGWYEGGPTIKTTCQTCKGTGKIYKPNMVEIHLAQVYKTQAKCAQEKVSEHEKEIERLRAENLLLILQDKQVSERQKEIEGFREIVNGHCMELIEQDKVISEQSQRLQQLEEALRARLERLQKVTGYSSGFSDIHLEMDFLQSLLDKFPEVPNTTLTKEQMRQQDDLSEQREEYD